MDDWEEWAARILRAYRALDGADYYAVLGVPRDADEAAIRRAYYGRATQLHPDRLVGAPEPGRSQATSIFKRVAEAYQTLGDPELRRIYDRTLDEGGEKRLTISNRLSIRPREDGWFLRTEGGRKHYLAARQALEEGSIPMARLNARIAIQHEGEIPELRSLLDEIERADPARSK
jgi:curved DNA-binding protein CbpA